MREPFDHAEVLVGIASTPAAERLLQALRGLGTPGQGAGARELLVELYVARGLSSDATARQLGRSSQTVREQLRR